jgi:hypothetical protein
MDALAAALARLAENPAEVERLGQTARRRVEQFPWTAYGDRVALVHRLLATGKTGMEIRQALSAGWPQID